MKIKNSIVDLYRAQWLDTACFCYMSGCIQNGSTVIEAVRRFQDFLNLGEEELDSDSLITSYYRSQRRFRRMINAENQKFKVDDEIERIIEEKIKKQTA